ncbi:MAG TPA: metallophosphoesterase family protein [Pirellulales bacterium]|nr:metallophosphoesterase family protein [Pirellulales bacterium]
MKKFVIGDIHGCYTALLAVVDAAGITPEDCLITLGDYIDRGPEVRQVLEWLLDRQQTGQLIPLLGNHELMMQASREDTQSYQFWLACGGEDTLRAYTPENEQMCLDHFPEEHWKFIENDCHRSHETETHIFVHASLHPGLPLNRQYEQVLFWDRCLLPPPHHSGKIMVCGHTPQVEGIPANYGHAVCLDTGVYLEGGWLTCLDVASGKYWQANQSGATRSCQLGDPRPS